MARVRVLPARTREEVYDRIDRWHDGGYADLTFDGRECELHEFLGWTWEEYAEYVETGRLPFYKPNRPQPVDETPETWQTFAVFMVILLIAVVIIVINLGGGA